MFVKQHAPQAYKQARDNEAKLEANALCADDECV